MGIQLVEQSPLKQQELIAAVIRASRSPFIMSPCAGGSAGAAWASTQLIVHGLPQTVRCHLQAMGRTMDLTHTTELTANAFIPL